MWWNREKKKRKPQYPEIDWEFEYRRLYKGVQQKLSQLDFLIARDLPLIADETARKSILATHQDLRMYMEFLNNVYRREE